MSPEEVKALREALGMTYEQFGLVFGANNAFVRKTELMAFAKKAVERAPKSLAGTVQLAMQHGGPVFALYQLLKWAIEPDHVLGIDKGQE